jgi:hypothetical protein
VLRNSIEAVPAFKQVSSPPAHTITLTPVRTAPFQRQVSISIFELIAYSQCIDFTRLNLTGRRVLDVKETTDQIDRLVRDAASQTNLPQVETTASAA